MFHDDFLLYEEYRSFTRGDMAWSVEEMTEDAPVRADIARFLRSCNLELDDNVAAFVTVRQGRNLVACAGMGDNIVKCVAVSPQLRGENITSRLITEVTHLAAEVGRFHLFLYTKPENSETFERCGFYPLVEMPKTIVLMENTPVGLKRYRESLATKRQPGARIGCIVMNANPFTFGHEYLARAAEESCDWLHVFVVGENSSLITYDDRFALVCEGLKDCKRTTIHPGSPYMISKATFPSYFLKDRGIVDQCHTALDLLIFREHIAPALGITHRYVGTEPYCQVTHKYNADMKYWLMAAPAGASRLTVVEIERAARSGRAISASEVRRCLRSDDFAAMAELAPPATIELLRRKYFDPAARAKTGTG